jgi:adenylate kinase family enzyme
MRSYKDPLPTPPKRVLVAGVSGAGKTTLARRIAAVTGGPHTEIDALFHGPAWTPRAEFLADVRSLIRTSSWTTEWQYDAARPQLAGSADV